MTGTDNDPSMRKQRTRGGPCPPRGFQTINWGGYSKKIDNQLEYYSKRKETVELEGEGEELRK